MKKAGVLILVLLLISFVSVISFSYAQDPSANFQSSGGDVQKITNITGKLPVNDSGLDFTKINITNTSAQARLDAINAWLDSNATIFKIIFNMTPQISWLFIFDVLILLWFFTIFILNAPIVMKKVFINLSTGMAYLVGAGMFILIWVIRFPYVMALFLAELVSTWWGNLIMLVLLIFGEVIIAWVMKFWNKSLMNQEKKQESLDREVLHNVVKPLTE